MNEVASETKARLSEQKRWEIGDRVGSGENKGASGRSIARKRLNARRGHTILVEHAPWDPSGLVVLDGMATVVAGAARPGSRARGAEGTAYPPTQSEGLPAVRGAAWAVYRT